MEDKYFKLKSAPETPLDEICKCDNIEEIYLAYKLGYNPVFCCTCNGEVVPERLAYSNQLVEKIASWTDVYGALYKLWLDSGEYEIYAKEKLEDPNSQVNKDGLELIKSLSAIRSCFYLWFDENSVESEAKEKCPNCGDSLTSNILNFRLCQQCKILL